MNSITE